jgi:hypothetical protein
MGCIGNSLCNMDSAAPFDFISRRATTFSYKVTFKLQSAGSVPGPALPEDISQSQFYMQVRMNGSLALNLNEANGMLSKVGSTLNIYVPASIMTIPPGRYVYDLMQEDMPSGVLRARLAGNFTINQNVTIVT